MSGWQHIFNGSGTKQRSIQESKKQANMMETESKTWTRIVKQREIIKSLSSQHINSVVSKGNSRSSLFNSTRPRIPSKQVTLTDFHPEVKTSLCGLMAKANKTKSSLENVLLLLSKT